MELGFGPMSEEIVRALAEWTKLGIQRRIMLIASRSQVDADEVGGGYVCSTSQLGELVASLDAPRLQLCRDHCGPYLSRLDVGLDMEQAVERCRQTISSDLKAGFSLIHVDASQCGEAEKEIAQELIRHTRSEAVDEVEFEYGSEDNVGVAASEANYERDLKFICDLISPRFVVGQTGSLVLDAKQSGSLDIERTKRLVAMAEDYGTKLKEHNADFLSFSQISMRKTLGVHACNIAPQLGTVQAQVVHRLAYASGLDAQWEDFFEEVLAGPNWGKWKPSSAERKYLTAAHYHFADPVFEDLRGKLRERIDYDTAVEWAIWDVVDRYAD